jgi:predicted transposase/invertase (TIGR01784 family)
MYHQSINALGVPVMKQAIDAFHSITVSPEFREIERLYAKARHDEAQALRHERLEAEAATTRAIAKNLLLKGIPLETIVEVTGLSLKDVEKLRDAD